MDYLAKLEGRSESVSGKERPSDRIDRLLGGSASMVPRAGISSVPTSPSAAHRNGPGPAAKLNQIAER